jgi:tetratricopeptide (TPR) repeat protein
MRAVVLAAMRQLDAAFASADKAVCINPTNAFATSERMDLLIAAGRAREAILPLDEVTLIYEKLNLADFMRLQCLARVYASHLDDAPKACESWYALGGDVAALETLASIYGSRGEVEKAANTVAILLKTRPNASIGSIRKARQPSESAFPALASQAELTFYAGLRRASLPE